jgi:hypothetical protein
MRKVEDAHRVVAMTIDEGLQPLRPVLHRRYLSSALNPPPPDLDASRISKAGGVA